MRRWRIAKSLETLKRQLNKEYPDRSKRSDGGIGDAQHRSKKSDHNPWVDCPNSGQGVVTARDFTHDPEYGIDCNQLAERLRTSADPRIKYVIWNKRIFSSTNKRWRWRKFHGKNPHTKHLHISVQSNPELFDCEKLWRIYSLIRIGSRGGKIRGVQKELYLSGFLKESEIDGIFGEKTEAAVKLYQELHRLEVDGIVGRQTLAKMKIK